MRSFDHGSYGAAKSGLEGGSASEPRASVEELRALPNKNQHGSEAVVSSRTPFRFHYNITIRNYEKHDLYYGSRGIAGRAVPLQG